MLQFTSGSSLYGRMVQELYCFIFTSHGPGENIYILKFIQKYEEVVEVVQLFKHAMQYVNVNFNQL